MLFAARGITPVGYAAFAFVLGVTAGYSIRRTIPAMASTLAGFAVIQVIWANWIRPALIAPVHMITKPREIYISHDNSMLISATPLRSQGAGPVSQITKGRTCSRGTPAGGPVNLYQCAAGIGSLHLRQLITYQPASRYWTLQWYETAIFLAAAVALAGFFGGGSATSRTDCAAAHDSPRTHTA